MSRLANEEYLYQRNRLRVSWFEHGGFAFARLNSQEQMDLHDYFAPSKDLSDEELIAHRVAIAEAFPSLPQKAGKAYQEITAHLEQPKLPPTPLPNRAARRRPTRGPRHVIVRTVRRPEVDVYKLSRALLALAKAEMVKQDAKEAEDHRDVR